jgi:hypothetical protein
MIDGVAEIGRRLRPDRCGRGIGASFIEAGLRFAVGVPRS